MKQHHIHLTLASIAILSLLFSSCAGQSSNPLDKYPGLKMAAPSEPTLETQTVVQPDLFEIEINGSNKVNQSQFVGQFIEGQSSQTLIRVVSKSKQVTNYRLEMADFSSTERPSLSKTQEPNVFSLTWNPPVGVIPGGKSNEIFKAKFFVTVTAADHPLLLHLVNSKELDVIVNRNDAQPKIIGYTDLKKGVDEGVPTTFTVDVEDPTAESSPRLPSVLINRYAYSNTEAYRANASQFIFLDESKKTNPEKIGKNLFRFHFILDVDQLPLDRDRLGREIPTASSVNICFQMLAMGALKTFSSEIQICSIARYAAQAATLAFNETELASIQSGQDNTISFRAHADHPQAVLSVKKAATQITGLNGTKSLECQYENEKNKNDLICALKWKPLCQKTDSKKYLTLKVDNELGGKTKTTTETKELTILADPALCAKPKQGGQ